VLGISPPYTTLHLIRTCGYPRRYAQPEFCSAMPKAATHLTVLQGVSPLRRDYNSPRFRLLRESSRGAVTFSADSEQPTHYVLAPEKTPIRNASFLDRTRNRVYGAGRHIAHDSIALKPDDIGATVLSYPLIARFPAHGSSSASVYSSGSSSIVSPAVISSS
jgi:hypothetical protein